MVANTAGATTLTLVKPNSQQSLESQAATAAARIMKTKDAPQDLLVIQPLKDWS